MDTIFLFGIGFITFIKFSYIQGKCDEKMYNELKTEIELEKEKLQKDIDKYLEIDNETDEMLANIAEVAANIGNFLKNPKLLLALLGVSRGKG